jgi:hypothetical protein
MNKITDMLGQDVQIGDKIAASFRTYYGTAPQLRIGTVVDIVERKSSERNGYPSGDARPLETHLKVQWTHSSSTAEMNEKLKEMVDSRASRGVSSDHIKTNQEYPERVTEILVRLKRFIRIN